MFGRCVFSCCSSVGLCMLFLYISSCVVFGRWVSSVLVMVVVVSFSSVVCILVGDWVFLFIVVLV